MSADAGRPLLRRDFEIEAQDLEVRYGGVPALAGVSLALARGGITAIIGPSGCGKTSLLNACNRMSDLVPGCSVHGRLRIGATQVLDPATDTLALRRRVGMIFQKPNPLPLSIRRNFALPLSEHGVRRRADLEALMQASLTEAGLWDEVRLRLDAPALTLSGGQQQRLCIARAIALKPQVLLLDEPCSALDPLSSAVVEALILSLRGRYTQVVVTHNLAQARRIADDCAVFWLRDGVGRLIEHGPAPLVFEAPRDADTAAYVRGIKG